MRSEEVLHLLEQTLRQVVDPFRCRERSNPPAPAETSARRTGRITPRSLLTMIFVPNGSDSFAASRDPRAIAGGAQHGAAPEIGRPDAPKSDRS